MGTNAFATQAFVPAVKSTFRIGQPVTAEPRRTCNGHRPLTVCKLSSVNFSRRALSVALPISTVLVSCPAAWSKEDVRDSKQRLYENVQEVKLPNGIRYLDLSVGSGPEVALDDVVAIHYTSRLLGFNGKTLDSSYAHVVEGFPEPFTFRLGDPDVIQGLSSMMLGMQVGGKRRAIIPPSLSYQSSMDEPRVADFQALRRLESVIGNPNRDATVLFDVELLKRKPS